jgi:hypothetical protein
MPQEPVTTLALLQALRKFRSIADECHAEWDADNDHRVGKILKALSGRMPGYRADIDKIHAVISAASKESP